MKSALFKLESFDGDRARDDAPLSPKDAETLRAAAYEDGYRAGWSDALEQCRTDEATRRAAAQEALQAVAFSFHEAREDMERCVMDLATQLIDRLLPGLLVDAMPRLLDRELRVLATRHLSDRLVLVCAPTACDSLEGLAADVPGLNVKLVAEPSFSDAQVQIRIDDTTRMIDLDAVLAVLREAVTAPAEQKEAKHG